VPEQDIPSGYSERDLDGGILTAGFLDTQVNGGGGVLFNDRPEVDTLRTMAAAHRKFGTTGFLPTIISDASNVIDRAMRAVEDAIAANVRGVLGIHIEGPMLSPARNGIHDTRHFRKANQDFLDLLCSLKAGATVVTLAPEMVTPQTIEQLTNAGVIVSAGHSEASYEQMQAAFSAGLSGVTHLFNAMPPLINRTPGLVGASLENNDIWCGIIADGVHVHPATLRLAMRCHRLDRFMLVTDGMPPAGTEATSFEMQGRTIFASQDRYVDAQGTLAGANLTMARAVRNAIDLLDLPATVAFDMASRSPAAFLGQQAIRGAIAPGMAADLVWLDDKMRPLATWIGGEALWEVTHA